MDDTDATKSSHGGSHVGFGDGVHGGRDAGDREGDIAGETGSELDGVSGEVNVVRKEDDIVVGVGKSLIEELFSCKAVLHGDCTELQAADRGGEKDGRRIGFLVLNRWDELNLKPGGRRKQLEGSAQNKSDFILELTLHEALPLPLIK